MLTPYQFASNRPIDGIDLDGLEYYTYHILVSKGKPHLFRVDDYTTMSEAQAIKMHGTNDFYGTYSKSFGEKGRGVEFKYYDRDNGLSVNSLFFNKESKTVSDQIKHGVYYGPGSPTTFGPRFEEDEQPTKSNPYNFNIPPVDEVDALARQHDIDYDYPGYQPGGFLDDPNTVPMDISFIRGLQDYLARVQQKGYVDKYTGKAPSTEAIEAARNAATAFTQIALKKEFQGLFNHGKKEIGNKIEKVLSPDKSEKDNKGGPRLKRSN
jgi:hypothetical protein